MPPDEALRAVVDSPYTRYPVYRGSLDDVVGVLHVRDLFGAMHDLGLASVELESIVRPAYVVPETKDLAALLADFRREKQHMAIVIDEYGDMEGIVTLEDLLEEIVGDIEDEFDLPDTSIERIDETHIRIDGTYTIDDFNEEFGTELEQEDFHTMAGLVFGELGRAPEVGDAVRSDGLQLSVLEVEGSRIMKIEVEFGPDDETRRTSLLLRSFPHEPAPAGSPFRHRDFSLLPCRWSRSPSRCRWRSSRSAGRSTRSGTTRSTSV